MSSLAPTEDGVNSNSAQQLTPSSTGIPQHIAEGKSVDLLSRCSMYYLAVRALSQREHAAAFFTYAAMLATFMVQVSLMCMLLHAAQTGRTAIGVDPESAQRAAQLMQFKGVQLQLCSMLQYMQQLPGLNTSSISAPPALDNYGCVLASYNMSMTSSVSGAGNVSVGNCSTTFSGWGTNSTVRAPFLASTQRTSAQPNARELVYEAAFLVLLVLVVVQCYALREWAESLMLWHAIRVYAGSVSAEKLDVAGCTVHTWFQHPGSKARLVFAFIVPVLQFTTVVLAFCSAATLITLPTLSLDKVQLVLNGVAIVFVLEVDDKVGDALSMVTHQHKRTEDVPLVTLGEDGVSLLVSPVKRAWVAGATFVVEWVPYLSLCVILGYYVARMVNAMGWALGANRSDVSAAANVFSWFIMMVCIAVQLVYTCYLCCGGRSSEVATLASVTAADSGASGAANAADAA